MREHNAIVACGGEVCHRAARAVVVGFVGLWLVIKFFDRDERFGANLSPCPVLTVFSSYRSVSNRSRHVGIVACLCNVRRAAMVRVLLALRAAAVSPQGIAPVELLRVWRAVVSARTPPLL